MDTGLQNLRRAYYAEQSHQNAMKLAGALLRMASLDHYQSMAAAGDAESTGLLRHMRAILLFEDLFHELRERPGGDAIFVDPDTDVAKDKYINAYCHKRPVASVTASTYSEALAARDFLVQFFKDNTFLLLPERLRLDARTGQLLNRLLDVPPAPLNARLRAGSHRAEHQDELLVATVFEEQYCRNVRILVEDAPCFDFSFENAPANEIWTPGQKQIQLRALAEEDFVMGEYGRQIKEFSYEDLPTFAKPAINDVPSYAVASLVTRGQVNDIDGPAWVNYYQPVAKVYVGYIYPWWEHNWSWNWDYTAFRLVCQQTASRVADALERATQQGVTLSPRELEVCPYAGVEIYIDQHRERCQHCGNYYTDTAIVPGQLVRATDADSTVPPVPDYLNQVSAFLSRLYAAQIHGDIHSVLGGQDLTVGIRPETYGPD